MEQQLTTELPKPTLLTISQFSNKHQAFSQASLRWLIFQSKPRHSSKGVVKPNGLESALVRIGRKILIDEDKFFIWAKQQSNQRVQA